MAWEHGNLKTDINTYYNITLFLSANIGRNYWSIGFRQWVVHKTEYLCYNM